MPSLFRKKDIVNDLLHEQTSLTRTLTAKDLVIMGVGVIVGSGITLDLESF